ncbi:MAG: glycosyltransferase [Spirochaetae bacterium HGW-Spirochaetae-1]|jgi:glycosyltransferase involved in cell wall biosynthesis|nr:MAG: glycosyltransferase [Spirochaetae bacterium HGW-Spirochaetae-1]
MGKERRLKIVMVADVYDGSRNGAMVSTERFVNLLRKKHEVTVLSTGKELPGKVVLPSFYVPIPGIRSIMEKTGFPFAWPKRELLEKAFTGADVIHIQFPFYLGIRALSIARKMGIPVVASFHVQPENMIYSLGIRSEYFLKILYRFFLKRMYNKVEAVICPSKFAESELKNFGLTTPSFVISNGIMPEFRPVKIKKDDSLKDKFIIYSVGRLAREKRHNLIMEAIMKSRHREYIQLVLAGKGPLIGQLIEQGKAMPVRPIIGYVSHADLIKYYNMADLYVHTSEVELESLTVLEAIACGLPVLIGDSKISAAQQFALNDAFIFSSGNSRDLADQIDYWFEHRNELAKASKDYFELSKRYRIEKSIEKLEYVYYEALSQGSVNRS